MSQLLRGTVVGSPVSHSLSPTLHRSAFEFLGIAGEYSRQDVPAHTFLEYFNSAKDNCDYFSITMPLKEEALALPVIVDPLSKRIQSANTLYRREGEWYLTSTDGSGLLTALHHQGLFSFRHVLVLGAGGTARAVVGALDGVAQEISVLGRSSTRRDALNSAVRSSDFHYLRWIDNPDFEEYDLVVNTTPAGAADLLADSLYPGRCSLLFDVIYKPWPTVLASRWSDCGGTVLSGLELLLYQAIAQLSLVLDQDFDHEAIATHLRPILLKAAQ